MRPKFQKRSALKFDGRIIPEAKPSGINVGFVGSGLNPESKHFETGKMPVTAKKLVQSKDD
jgi:hypothetical protein